MKTHIKPVEVIFTDDDQDDLDFFREALLKVERPTNLTTFNDCEGLMKYLGRKKSPPSPDLLFLDINMPKMDGLTCLHNIRENQQYRKLPIIMFTTSLRPLDVEQSYRWGANLYIKKPGGFEELVVTLKRLFSKQWFERLVQQKKPTYTYPLPRNGTSQTYNPILSEDI
jgi:CheY-like chemotaxis protein